ncbi:MAG: RDD family protein [Clostridia bacterium]|nr:RDD family protein [Clostridia bacterium]
MLDLQKAGLWKRVSAALFDLILLGIVAVGVALGISAALDYDGHSERFEAVSESYEHQYGVDFDISYEEYTALSEQERATHDAAYAAFAADEQANRLYALMFQFTLLILIFGVLGAFLLLEFLVPLLLGNGQTLGKKIFGIGVMRADSVKISGPILFARSILGKYTVEVMLPILVVVMMSFGMAGMGGTLVLVLLFGAEVALLLFTKEHVFLHDKLSHTVAVDIAAQRIFDSPEALLAYKQRLHAEAAERAEG